MRLFADDRVSSRLPRWGWFLLILAAGVLPLLPTRAAGPFVETGQTSDVTAPDPDQAARPRLLTSDETSNAESEDARSGLRNSSVTVDAANVPAFRNGDRVDLFAPCDHAMDGGKASILKLMLDNVQFSERPSIPTDAETANAETADAETANA